VRGSEVILKLDNIVKTFPGVKALDEVHLEVLKGEVHALCGENGAGKSTLMKIISGAQVYTSGTMVFEGKEVKFASTKQAQDSGISMIYQEFNLIPYLTVAENLFLDRQPVKRGGIIDWKKLNADAKLLLARVGLDLNPEVKVQEISLAEAQMVEIAKCLSLHSKVIIMDEPTAALSDEEIKKLFEIIKSLTSEGISIIYISHRMEEIFAITDRITVFRDGRYIKSMLTKETDYDEVVKLMVGKNVTDLYPNRNYKTADVVLAVKDMKLKHVNGVDFQLHKGEILGITGLMGAGCIHLCKALFGCYDTIQGDISIQGEKVNIKQPLDALKKGISLVPDDRKNQGLVLLRSVRENITLASLDHIAKKKILRLGMEASLAEQQINQLNIKVSTAEQITGNLSGGNQQKVVFAKMLLTNPTILILAEPTRGVDVGAKAEIYQIMNTLTEKGISIILVSSDYQSLLA
jgi:ribose transport system ATP-binding protein